MPVVNLQPDTWKLVVLGGLKVNCCVFSRLGELGHVLVICSKFYLCSAKTYVQEGFEDKREHFNLTIVLFYVCNLHVIVTCTWWGVCLCHYMDISAGLQNGEAKVSCFYDHIKYTKKYIKILNLKKILMMGLPLPCMAECIGKARQFLIGPLLWLCRFCVFKVS